MASMTEHAPPRDPRDVEAEMNADAQAAAGKWTKYAQPGFEPFAASIRLGGLEEALVRQHIQPDFLAEPAGRLPEVGTASQPDWLWVNF